VPADAALDVAPDPSLAAAAAHAIDPAPPAATPEPRASRPAQATPAPLEPAVVAEAPAPEPAPEAPTPQPAQGPSYEFMNRLGLPVPPGGILDAQNSDTRMLLFDAESKHRPEPAVLTFRTAAGIDDVLAFYAASGIRGFRARTVQMGGDFLGVERTVARASTRGRSGREARITVSRPGIDQAARQLVPETTIRIELF
jgi:hypothetical protein